MLHAVPVGRRGADIDHVVVGPGGVFTINTKTHPGAKVWVGSHTVMIGRTKLPYVRNSRFEAERAARLLSRASGHPVAVTGIIAILCSELRVKQQPEPGVVITGYRGLLRYLRAQPQVLTPAEVEAIFDVDRRGSVWTSTT